MIPHLTILRQFLWKFNIFAHVVTPPCIQHTNPSPEGNTTTTTQTRRRLHLSYFRSNISDSLLRVSQGPWSCFILDVKNIWHILKHLRGLSMIGEGDLRVTWYELAMNFNYSLYILAYVEECQLLGETLSVCILIFIPKIFILKIFCRGNISWCYLCHDRFVKNLHMKL